MYIQYTKQKHLRCKKGVSAKGGLWTMDWTVDCNR